MSIAKNTREPELQDFGVTPEEYALYNRKDSKHCSWRSLVVVPSGAFILGFVVMYLARFDWASALAFGIVMVALSGLYVIGCVWLLVDSAIVRLKRTRLLQSPVASQIKLYEESLAAYREVQWEAERARREAEKARRRAETERLEIERARRRKLEGYWMSLSGTDFERELATVLRGLGYRVKSTPSSGDEGVDLVLKRPGKTIVVQCKAHKNPVGPAIARELLGSMIHFKADRAILACTGGFTRGVKEFVRDKPIDLVAVSELARLGAQVEGKDIHDTPICAKCARAMVFKEGSHGKFWGCPGYPRCRETRDADEW